MAVGATMVNQAVSAVQALAPIQVAVDWVDVAVQMEDVAVDVVVIS